ncbi:MAG: RnfH family protein [Candidatus Dactylopiibacterium sp.]|nr:RnfH family protein [Candidatus Dactylopiibacterium sp.]
MKISVCYALPQRQEILELDLPEGSVVEDAVTRSGLLARYPEISLADGKFGIYGKISRSDAVLREGDRVEIYRPLIADPKEVRRKRAEEGRATKKGGGDL